MRNDLSIFFKDTIRTSTEDTFKNCNNLISPEATDFLVKSGITEQCIDKLARASAKSDTGALTLPQIVCTLFRNKVSFESLEKLGFSATQILYMIYTSEVSLQRALQKLTKPENLSKLNVLLTPYNTTTFYNGEAVNGLGFTNNDLVSILTSPGGQLIRTLTTLLLPEFWDQLSILTTPSNAKRIIKGQEKDGIGFTPADIISILDRAGELRSEALFPLLGDQSKDKLAILFTADNRKIAINYILEDGLGLIPSKFMQLIKCTAEQSTNIIRFFCQENNWWNAAAILSKKGGKRIFGNEIIGSGFTADDILTMTRNESRIMFFLTALFSSNNHQRIIALTASPKRTIHVSGTEVKGLNVAPADLARMIHTQGSRGSSSALLKLVGYEDWERTVAFFSPRNRGVMVNKKLTYGLAVSSNDLSHILSHSMTRPDTALETLLSKENWERVYAFFSPRKRMVTVSRKKVEGLGCVSADLRKAFADSPQVDKVLDLLVSEKRWDRVKVFFTPPGEYVDVDKALLRGLGITPSRMATIFQNSCENLAQTLLLILSNPNWNNFRALMTPGNVEIINSNKVMMGLGFDPEDFAEMMNSTGSVIDVITLLITPKNWVRTCVLLSPAPKDDEVLHIYGLGFVPKILSRLLRSGSRTEIAAVLSLLISLDRWSHNVSLLTHEDRTVAQHAGVYGSGLTPERLLIMLKKSHGKSILALKCLFSKEYASIIDAILAPSAKVCNLRRLNFGLGISPDEFVNALSISRTNIEQDLREIFDTVDTEMHQTLCTSFSLAKKLKSLLASLTPPKNEIKDVSNTAKSTTQQLASLLTAYDAVSNPMSISTQPSYSYQQPEQALYTDTRNNPTVNNDYPYIALELHNSVKDLPINPSYPHLPYPPQNNDNIVQSSSNNNSGQLSQQADLTSSPYFSTDNVTTQEWQAYNPSSASGTLSKPSQGQDQAQSQSQSYPSSSRKRKLASPLPYPCADLQHLQPSLPSYVSEPDQTQGKSYPISNGKNAIASPSYPHADLQRIPPPPSYDYTMRLRAENSMKNVSQGISQNPSPKIPSIVRKAVSSAISNIVPDATPSAVSSAVNSAWLNSSLGQNQGSSLKSSSSLELNLDSDLSQSLGWSSSQGSGQSLTQGSGRSLSQSSGQNSGNNLHHNLDIGYLNQEPSLSWDLDQGLNLNRDPSLSLNLSQYLGSDLSSNSSLSQNLHSNQSQNFRSSNQDPSTNLFSLDNDHIRSIDLAPYLIQGSQRANEYIPPDTTQKNYELQNPFQDF